MDRFFNQMMCDRCGGDLAGGRIMSMLNTDCICMECKDKERMESDYRMAQQMELEQVKLGNYHYKGMRGGAVMDYEKAWKELKAKVTKAKSDSYQSLNWERGGAMAEAFRYVQDSMTEMEGEGNENR